MCALVDEGAQVGRLVVHGTGLCLQREADLRGAVDDGSGGLVRVGPEELGLPLQDGRQLLQHGRCGGGLAGVDGVVDLDAAPGGVLLDLEPADRGRGQVGGHRLVLAPAEGGLAARGALWPRKTPLATAVRPWGTVIVKSYEDLSVGWSLPGNQVDGALRLPGDEDAVVGGDPAVLRAVRVDDRLGDAGVGDGDLEGLGSCSGRGAG